MSLGESGGIGTVSARILLEEQIKSRTAGCQEAILNPLCNVLKADLLHNDSFKAVRCSKSVSFHLRHWSC